MADIHYMPTCSECGTTLDERTVGYEEYLMRNGDFSVLNTIIYPRICPKCNAKFDRMTISSAAPFQRIRRSGT